MSISATDRIVVSRLWQSKSNPPIAEWASAFSDPTQCFFGSNASLDFSNYYIQIFCEKQRGTNKSDIIKAWRCQYIFIRSNNMVDLQEYSLLSLYRSYFCSLR